MSQIQFKFYLVPSADDGKKDLSLFCKNQLSYAQVVWNPKVPPETGGPVYFQWDGKFSPVAEKNNEYKLIEIYEDRSPQAIKLIDENDKYNAGAVVPVFLCWSAWFAREDGGKPHAGPGRGFSVVRRGITWFKGHAAILLFVSSTAVGTLAHELSHWFGYIHKDVKDDPGNVGMIGGGGTHLLQVQYHSMMRWANDAKVRERFTRPIPDL